MVLSFSVCDMQRSGRSEWPTWERGSCVTQCQRPEPTHRKKWCSRETAGNPSCPTIPDKLELPRADQESRNQHHFIVNNSGRKALIEYENAWLEKHCSEKAFTLPSTTKSLPTATRYWVYTGWYTSQAYMHTHKIIHINTHLLNTHPTWE